MPLKIYPGPPMWSKRLAHTIVLGAIGFNLWLGEVQNYLLGQSRQIVESIDPYLPTATTFAAAIEGAAIPVLEKLETSKLGWMSTQYDLPSSTDLKLQVDNINELEKTCIAYKVSFNVAQKIIWWSNILMWVPIIFSGCWLFQDIKLGKYKIIPLLCLISALIVNMGSHALLNMYWPIG